MKALDEYILIIVVFTLLLNRVHVSANFMRNTAVKGLTLDNFRPSAPSFASQF